MQPLWINDAAEASDKRSRLLLNLCVHPEVGHEVDVADSAGHDKVNVIKISGEFYRIQKSQQNNISDMKFFHTLLLFY